MAGPRRLPYLPGMSAGLPIPVRSRHLEGAEVAWFAPICNGDFEFLGVPDGRYRSSWANASAIVREADRLGYRNVLCPSSYQPGQDTLPFVAALSQVTDRINLLAAVRCGEVWPPMLARTLATIDHMLRGRLTVNIISSDLPGEQRPSAERYARSREVIRILRQAWTAERIEHDGRFYRLDLPTDPVRPYQQNGGPLLYFGGYSPDGQDLCAEFCDVYLLWPETEDRLEAQMREMADRAAAYGRTIDYGLRVHVIVRETEAEARAAARRLVSQLDDETGRDFRERAQDARSLGVAGQTGLRERSDAEGFAEPNLWTGIGRGRSGCGAALVGDPDQVLAKIRRYMDLGFRAFIFSGYPHLDECRLFARHVLPHIPTLSLPEAYGRVPAEDPPTPLAAGPRR
jgi:alkanesulfonate monooxygenase